MLAGTTKVDTLLHGQVPISALLCDGLCLTPKGLQKFTDVEQGDYAQMVRVTFSDGSTVECTPDHNLVERGGLVMADKSLGKYCFIMTSPNRFVRVIKVEDIDEAPGWSLRVLHHEHRFNVNGGIVVGG
jgi:hypothetical protein